MRAVFLIASVIVLVMWFMTLISQQVFDWLYRKVKPRQVRKNYLLSEGAHHDHQQY
jgi:hypothetical protein